MQAAARLNPGILAQALALACLLTGAPVIATEKPHYDVVASNDIYEIRRYDPYIVAEVDIVADSERQAGDRAFRILAGYIFGDNRPRQRMAMTAPVETTATNSGEEMAMTAPVKTTTAADGYTYAFVMERKFTLDTLPEPLDPRIRIREKPARYVAALRFSGLPNAQRYEEHREQLETALDIDRMHRRGEFVLARYNAPFTPPFMRRNEVLVDVDWPRRDAEAR